MGCEKSIFRSFRTCQKRSESLHWILRNIVNEKNDQRTHTCFLAKYGGLSLYDIDMKNIYSIEYKGIDFVKGYGYALTWNPDHPDGASTDHKYFCFHDDLFDRILETEQDSDITLNVIHRETSLPLINVKISNQRS